MKDRTTIENEIEKFERELADLEEKRAELKEKIHLLRNQQISIAEKSLSYAPPNEVMISNESPEEEKIHLFQSLFQGRPDVYQDPYPLQQGVFLLNDLPI